MLVEHFAASCIPSLGESLDVIHVYDFAGVWQSLLTA